ncbi:MAG: NUDIX hydrolase [Planctomycetota bacterium]|nr:NUDIX hydrolase [Planctomycetota bacterium]
MNRPPKKLFQAKRFAIEEVYELLPDGSQVVRNIVRHPGAVVILPLIDLDHVCLIRTYRVAIDRWHLELPAGTLDKSLSPLDTAILELQEETGYRAKLFTHIHDFAMSPGILDEKMHFYVAEGLALGESAREAGEQIDNTILSWAEVDRQLRDKKITDAKTVACLLWYMRYGKYA